MADIIYDVIIIGAGPAGLTSGIYTSRHNISTLILGSQIGGKAGQAEWIENYPGFLKGISGKQLMTRMEKQAARFGSNIKSETVYAITKFNEYFMVSTRSGDVYQSISLIIATGVNREVLNVPGEMKYKGRGVSYCGVCDGPFFRDKRVIVIGSGKDAVHDIELLSGTSAKVIGIPQKKGYIEDIAKLQDLIEEGKVEILPDVKVVEIGGGDFVEYVVLDSGVRVDAAGVFVVLEQVNMAGLFEELGVETDMDGCILTDAGQETSVSGVFAAGDCCCNGFQVVTATGMGATAALSAMKYVRSRKS